MLNQPPRNPWILIPKPQPNARIRMFCLPYAGAGPTVFNGWPDALDSRIEVTFIQFPGRGARFRETPLRRLTTATQQLADAIEPFLDKPYMLFGHSLGALTGFELARELRRRGLRIPEHLFVCARSAPHILSDWMAIHCLPNDQLVKEVQARYGGIPQAILSDPELLELFLPILRADLEILETYEYTPEGPLDCDITAYGGYQDRAVRKEQIEAWSEHTTGHFAQQMFPGNHFFVQQTPAFFQSFTSRLANLGI
jgi:medium-chain acyl-[acyl-carrier-protein] hydrolase